MMVNPEGIQKSNVLRMGDHDDVDYYNLIGRFIIYYETDTVRLIW